MSLCRIAELIRSSASRNVCRRRSCFSAATEGEIEEDNLSSHSGSYARCVPSQEEDGQRQKTLKMSSEEMNIDGDVQGDCRRWEQIDESILEFLGG